MEKVVLGRTGLEVTAAGLGCGGHSRLGMVSKGFENACNVVRYAYDNGVNFFDTAYVYGTQPAVGTALEGIRRDSYVLSSKFPYTVDGKVKPASDLEINLDKCLEELKTDYIDIFHIHGVRPELYIEVRDRFYPELMRMREKGKIRFSGITEGFGSDTTHEMLKLALADDLWDVIMVGYNIINPSAAKTILPITLKKNVGTLCMHAVRSSLSNPALLKLDVQKMIAEGQVDKQLVKEDNALDFLVENGYSESIMDAAYSFCRHTKGIDVTLTGTGAISHLSDNLNSISKPRLSDSALEKLEMMFGKVDCVSAQQSKPAK